MVLKKMGMFISRGTLIQSRVHKLNNLMVMVSSTYGCQGHDDIGIFFSFHTCTADGISLQGRRNCEKRGAIAPPSPIRFLQDIKHTLFFKRPWIYIYLLTSSDFQTFLQPCITVALTGIFLYMYWWNFVTLQKKHALLLWRKKKCLFFLHRVWLAYISSYVNST